MARKERQDLLRDGTPYKKSEGERAFNWQVYGMVGHWLNVAISLVAVGGIDKFFPSFFDRVAERWAKLRERIEPNLQKGDEAWRPYEESAFKEFEAYRDAAGPGGATLEEEGKAWKEILGRAEESFKLAMKEEPELIAAAMKRRDIVSWGQFFWKNVALLSGGFAVLPVIKHYEDHKKDWIRNYDAEHGPTPEMPVDANGNEYDPLDKEPKQTWASLLTGRFTSIGIGYGALAPTLSKLDKGLRPYNTAYNKLPGDAFSKLTGIKRSEYASKVPVQVEENKMLMSEAKDISNPWYWPDLFTMEFVSSAITAASLFVSSKIAAAFGHSLKDDVESPLDSAIRTHEKISPIGFDSQQSQVAMDTTTAHKPALEAKPHGRPDTKIHAVAQHDVAKAVQPEQQIV
ncbi:MAG: hypothetical protein CMM94_02485 [Rickettsiales bacterium]|nr:hypothetical protein [Rickettsiales bacterium]